MRTGQRSGYYKVSSAKRISIRAHIRAISEEIKKRKNLRKVESVRFAIQEQLLSLKDEVRYLCLARSYLDGKNYRTIERSVSSHKRVDAKRLMVVIHQLVSEWQRTQHTFEEVKSWLEV